MIEYVHINIINLLILIALQLAFTWQMKSLTQVSLWKFDSWYFWHYKEKLWPRMNNNQALETQFYETIITARSQGSQKNYE